MLDKAKYILVAVLASVAAAGCARVEIISESIPVTFTTYRQRTETKADASYVAPGGDFAEGAVVGVMGYYHDNCTFETDPSNITDYMYNTALTKQTDGYEVYESFENMPGKRMIGCWAHARRKFVEAMGENEKLASEALVYIGDFYHVETLAKEAEMSPDERMALRKEKAYPQIRKFEEWIEAKYPDTTEGSLIRSAMEYAYVRLPKLSMYVNNGDWLIDNNLVENAIRPLALGRKNYLFCGNDASAIRASMMYSFIATCKANDVDPRSWFEDVIRRIPEYERGQMDVTPLLPQHWKPTPTTTTKIG